MNKEIKTVLFATFSTGLFCLLAVILNNVEMSYIIGWWSSVMFFKIIKELKK